MNSSGLSPSVLKLITQISQNVMLTFELSSCLLEIPMMLIQHSVKIWLAAQHSVKSTASRLVDIKKINGKATLNINTPYSKQISPR